MGIWIAIIASIAAGAALAAEGLLQQGAASEGPADEDTKAMLKRVVHNKRWWAGLAAAGGSYGFQALALTFGPLALVQPVIVSEMLFAVPLSAKRKGIHLGKKAWLGVVAVIAGLGLGMGLANPKEGNPLAPPITEWAWALGGVAVIAALVLLITRKVTGTARASLFALAGGVTLALQSALFDATIQQLGQQGVGVFTHWQAYALIVVSFAGLTLVQEAYKAGPLSANLPIIDSVLPVGAIILGLWLFGETIRTSWWGLTGAALGLVLLIAGIITLDTSDAVRKQQEVEDEEQEEKAENQPAHEPDPA